MKYKFIRFFFCQPIYLVFFTEKKLIVKNKVKSSWVLNQHDHIINRLTIINSGTTLKLKYS